jgi:hypothetical protein
MTLSPLGRIENSRQRDAVSRFWYAGVCCSGLSKAAFTRLPGQGCIPGGTQRAPQAKFVTREEGCVLAGRQVHPGHLRSHGGHSGRSSHGDHGGRERRLSAACAHTVLPGRKTVGGGSTDHADRGTFRLVAFYSTLAIQPPKSTSELHSTLDTRHPSDHPFFASFAQESFSVIVRLKTSRSAVLSLSRAK